MTHQCRGAPRGLTSPSPQDRTLSGKRPAAGRSLASMMTVLPGWSISVAGDKNLTRPVRPVSSSVTLIRQH